MSDTALMGRPKKQGDRHKPGKQVRIPLRLAMQLDILAEKRVTSVPEEVKRAVRELLEREGLWPIHGDDASAEADE